MRTPRTSFLLAWPWVVVKGGCRLQEEGGEQVFSDCHKLPQTGWLTATEAYSLLVLDGKSLEPKCGQDHALSLTLLEENLFQGFPLASGSGWPHPWHFLTQRCIIPIFVSTVTGYSHFACLSLCIPAYKDTSHTGLITNPILISSHFNQLNLQQTYFW